MKLPETIKSILLFSALFLFASPLFAQSLTLGQCEQQALAYHPLSRQKDAIGLAKASDVWIANAQYLPKVTLATRATQQSEALSVTLPGGLVEASKTQWQLVGEIDQVVFDGGAIKAKKEGSIAESDVARSRNDLALEGVRSLVRQTYFNILLLDQQLEQVGVLQKELAANRSKLSAYLENGVVTQSDVDAIRVEELKSKSQEIELVSTRESLVSTLAQLTGLQIAADTTFERPIFQRNEKAAITSQRKEFNLFQAQSASLDAAQAMLNASLYPKLSVFAQVGYSQPGLNMLKTDPTGWGIVGVRGSLSLDGYYTYAASTEKINASREQVQAQIDQFNLDEGIKLKQKLGQIEQLEKAIELDTQIIGLKQSMKAASEAKMANGSLSVLDLIRELNEVSLAEITKAQHEIQLLFAESELSLIEGNGDYQG